MQNVSTIDYLNRNSEIDITWPMKRVSPYWSEQEPVNAFYSHRDCEKS